MRIPPGWHEKYYLVGNVIIPARSRKWRDNDLHFVPRLAQFDSLTTVYPLMRTLTTAPVASAHHTPIHPRLRSYRVSTSLQTAPTASTAASFIWFAPHERRWHLKTWRAICHLEEMCKKRRSVNGEQFSGQSRADCVWPVFVKRC